MNMIGHNNPPQPWDEVLARHADTLAEVVHWVDGEEVQNDAQMAAVDALIKGVKAANKDMAAAEEAASKPIYDAWKATKAEWAPHLARLDMTIKALVASVDKYKRKVAAEKAEKARIAAEEAAAARRAAWEATMAANPASVTEVEAAMEQQRAAKEAERAASAARNDTVKGLRTVHRFEVEDYKAAINWIAVNDRAAMIAFVDEYARKNHRDRQIGGVKSWTEKEAY